MESVNVLCDRISNFDLLGKESDVELTRLLYELHEAQKIGNDDGEFLKLEARLRNKVRDDLSKVSLDDTKRRIFDLILNDPLINFTALLVDYYKRIDDPNKIAVIHAVFQELRTTPPNDIPSYIEFLN